MLLTRNGLALLVSLTACLGPPDAAKDSNAGTDCVARLYYPDVDGDEYGDEEGAFESCDRPSAATTVGGDCDDADPARNPGAFDDCGDDIDQDCDGTPTPACGLSGSFSTDDAWVVFESSEQGELLGLSVAAGVWVDGAQTVALGAPSGSYNGTGGGVVWLFSDPTAGVWTTDDADAALYTEFDFGYLGGWVASAGDLDADGHEDLLVGDPLSDYTFSGAGAVWAIPGPISGTDTMDRTAWMRFDGDQADGFLGWAAEPVGDVTGDGRGDLVMGQSGVPGGERAGEAWVVSGDLVEGTDARVVWTGEPGDAAGLSVSGAGDVNGDGRRDVAVGAPYWRPDGQTPWGRVHLLTDPASGGGALSDNHTWEGDGAWSDCGVLVAIVQDHDGDGYDELAFPCLGDNAVYLIDGPPPPDGLALDEAETIIRSDDWTRNFGWWVADAGDLDLDGKHELLVTEHHEAGGNAATAHIFAGGGNGGILDPSAAVATIEGLQDGQGTWSQTASIPDWDGDGGPDLLMGSPGTRTDGGLGAAYLMLGHP